MGSKVQQRRLAVTLAALLLASAAFAAEDGWGSPPDPSSPPPRPHIILIIADDLGFNDVGFRGSNQIPTPNIDALAYSGVVLDRYYVLPVCTPSRAALMTGKHPIHTGMQHRVLFGAEPRGLPLSETLMPQHLRRLGYSTRLVGKWHLGSWRREYTPTYRGFDSHLGFWTGHHDYYDHTAVESPYWGLDMRRGMDPAWDLHGQYSTEVFTREAVRLVRSHNTSRPLFLTLAHAAVHSANPYTPLPAPEATVARFTDIADYPRRRFAAMLSEMDESVGRVVEALSQAGMLENSVIVFTTDNGGPAAGFNLNAASNWPLRGVKNTLWEGGVRGAGLLWSPLLARPGRVASQLLHVTDWLPTLYRAAGGEPAELHELDGLDAWAALSDDAPSPRSRVLHNIDDIFGNAALTVGNWKLLQGTTYEGQWDSWYGPSGRETPMPPYDVGQVIGSRVGRALARLRRPLTAHQVRSVRGAAEVRCAPGQTSGHTPAPEVGSSAEGSAEAAGPGTTPAVGPPARIFPTHSPCQPLLAPCLFNVRDDPCEKNNLADRLPGVLRHLQLLLTQLNATAVPAANLPWDSRADPRFWDHTWTNFGDYSVLGNTVS